MSADTEDDFAPRLGTTTGTTCVVAFASGASRFEWGGLLTRMAVPHVLMRDTTELWYQGGVRGIGDKAAVVSYVNDLTWRFDHVVTLGLSSGSYAALMFGQLARVDGVIAISPITGKGDALKDDFASQWWPRIEHGPEHPPVPDLKPLFARGLEPQVYAFVSDGEGTELDQQMALRIGIDAVNVIPGFSHALLARHMRDAGMIADLIRGGCWG